MEYSPKLDELEYVCKLMYDNLQLPIWLWDGNMEPVTEYTSNLPANPLFPATVDLFKSRLASDDFPADVPVLSSLNVFDHYISVRLIHNGRAAGAVVMGPSIVAEMTEEMLRGFMNDYHISGKHRDTLSDYYRSLPVKNKIMLLHAAVLLHHLIYGSKLDITDIIQTNVPLEQPSVPSENIDLSLSNRRQSFMFHQNPVMEKYVFRCIQDGRKEELIKHWNRLPRESFGVLSKKSRLRNEKNLAISSVTLATRAAIDGGLFPEIAYTVSDLYIQHIEELKEVNEVIKAGSEMLLDFAERVRNQKKMQYSKAIAVCQNYIFNHLYEDITLAKLAETARLSPGYLSQLFKKETCITISEYIQREKVEEAKKLLAFSDYSLLEICTCLNFHDQSYFIKIFKKHTGFTPRQYKNTRP
ncbi:helix-turn-helix domain-containing protein [Paenibacillus abyssi]|uniref:AraC family transcriptional regulator n=1 Tax=Paenibacillus abyssi TaxID=1340531 RepID=A0A917FUD1_9BACL|nr:helix-turn-helix domain-containing protein [Paenibacillus abyssi]GGG06063.1 AraC family transcriptional regulator [Paenibacillus abyssi]